MYILNVKVSDVEARESYTTLFYTILYEPAVDTVETPNHHKPCTGKSLSEAFILTSTNPQYDKRLFFDLPVQYMKNTRSEHVVYKN